MKWKLDGFFFSKIILPKTAVSRAATAARASTAPSTTLLKPLAEALETLAFAVFMTMFFVACQQPASPPATLPVSALNDGGAYILCEGLWRQDNSTLWRYDDSTGAAVGDVFASANPSLRLGDTANDMLLAGDTLFIAVSTSRTIEILRASTAQWLGRIRFDNTRQEPRRLTLFNDSTAYCSNLNDDSISEFDTRSFSVRAPRIAVGPAPEGIAATRRYILVANSGFGDFRAADAKAGSISVVQPETRQEMRILQGFPNVTEILANKEKTRFYASYRHLPSKPDSLGGVVEFDAETFSEIRRWRAQTPSSLCFSATGDTLFFLGARGVLGVNLSGDAREEPFLALENPSSRDYWYALAVRAETSQFWICNARNFSVSGEVLIYHTDKSLKSRFDVGLNPNRIVFFSR